MSPRHHEEKLLSWSYKNRGVPVISIDYKKAPEHPYPYALNECYDVYHSIIASRGRCVGLSGECVPRICLTGDSAGGNYAAGITLMILNATSTSSTGQLQEAASRAQGLPLPEGLILIYPSLDLNMSSWMSEEQMLLIRQRDARKTNRNVVRRKSEYYEKASGLDAEQRRSSDDDYEDEYDAAAPKQQQTNGNAVGDAAAVIAAQKEAQSRKTTGERKTVSTRLALTSRLSYFNDRILSPEMMRAMIILYIGPHARPDFASDFFLSPLIAPESLLARFPKTHLLTGERDPLVDDTVIFAGRIKAAKDSVARHRAALGLDLPPELDSQRMVQVSLISGISHGFLQMVALFPPARKEIEKCGRWIGQMLADPPPPPTSDEPAVNQAADGDGYAGLTSGDEDFPLEIGGLTKRGRERERGRGRGGRLQKRGSAISLGSEEHLDLMRRRMEGLAGGLTGTSDEDAN